MKAQEVQHLLQKLFDIDQQLGGNAKKTKSANDFDGLKEIIMEKLFALNKMLNEKEEKFAKFGNDRDNVAFGVRVRDAIIEIEKFLSNMDESLRKQAKNPKKYPKAELMQRTRQYENLKEQLENQKARSEGGVVNDDQVQLKVQTITEQRALFGANKGFNNQNAPEARYELTKDEEEAMNRWKQNDQEIDHKLDQIIDGAGLLKDKAKFIGQKIGQTQDQIGRLNKEVEKTNNTLNTQNARLKAILIQYRKPNKFCLDITLFLLFLGLIGVGYNMYQKK